jgi:4-diphosphocytidyl-2-C-methyl-D-erythritol kinase
MLSLKSPAKINLFLRIVGRRPDGYHDLASLFQAIDLYDTIHFAEAEQDILTCSNPSLPVDKSNLISKAVHLFRRKTGIVKPLSIHLEKRIPMEGGLGGGSSNAATTLWALNHLCGKPASDAELALWAVEIGSDISFFLSSGTAYCTGRGEILQSVPDLASQPILIVKPAQGLSTKQVFGKLNLSQLNSQDPKAALASFSSEKPIYFNDLETPAFELMPELAQFKQKLIHSGYSIVLMTGTGSSLFCLGEGRDPHLPDCQIFRTSFINRLPCSWYLP